MIALESRFLLLLCLYNCIGDIEGVVSIAIMKYFIMATDITPSQFLCNGSLTILRLLSYYTSTTAQEPSKVLCLHCHNEVLHFGNEYNTFTGVVQCQLENFTTPLFVHLYNINSCFALWQQIEHLNSFSTTLLIYGTSCCLSTCHVVHHQQCINLPYTLHLYQCIPNQYLHMTSNSIMANEHELEGP